MSKLVGAEFLDLRGTGKLAERITDKHGAGDFFLKHIAGVRNDDGNAGPHAIGDVEREMANANAANVGDRIERPWLKHAWRNCHPAPASWLTLPRSSGVILTLTC